VRKKRAVTKAAAKVPSAAIRKKAAGTAPPSRRALASRKRAAVPAHRAPGSPEPVLERVRAAIHSVRPAIPLARIRPEASLVADLGIDSLSLAQLSIALEDAFGRAIFLGDVFSELEDPVSITVGQLAELITLEP